MHDLTDHVVDADGSYDRRGLLRHLGAAAGIGAAASVTGSLFTGDPASAATGSALILGQGNSAGATTYLDVDPASSSYALDIHTTSYGMRTTTSDTGTAIVADSAYGLGLEASSGGVSAVYGASTSKGGEWAGVEGYASDVYGVKGESASRSGVLGITQTGPGGVQGKTSSASSCGVLGTGPGDAVKGVTSSTTGYGGAVGIATANGGFGVAGYGQGGSASIGVYGVNTAGTGTGIKGQSQSGIGVWGRATGGRGVVGQSSGAGGVAVQALATFGATALQVSGVAKFSRSGAVTVAAGSARVTVSNVALTSASIVLCTIQQHAPGVAISSAVPDAASASFTIQLTKAVTTSTKVGWFVVN